MTKPTIEWLLANRTIKLQWVEPWRSVDIDGNTVDADITLQATVEHCINLARNSGRHDQGQPLSELALLNEFMAVHWATVVPHPDYHYIPAY